LRAGIQAVMVLAIRQAMLTVVARRIKPEPQDRHVFEPVQTLPLTRRFDDLEQREIVKSVVQARGSEQAAASRTSLVQSEQQDLSVAIGETNCQNLGLVRGYPYAPVLVGFIVALVTAASCLSHYVLNGLDSQRR
jgi:hypothetical protein